MTPHLRTVLAALVAMLVAASALAAEPEYGVKALFLCNFAKYVEWPRTAGPVRICVIGEDPFGRSLDEVAATRTAHDRPIVVDRPQGLAEMLECDVAFVAASEHAELPRLLPALEAANVLTVGETNAFANQGGMITFRVQQNKVRFEINTAATDRAELRMSSQLLKLATKVVH